MRKEYQNDEKNNNEKKGLQVLKDGHLYKHRINKESIYWKYVQAKKESKCKGTNTISDNEQILSEIHHNENK